MPLVDDNDINVHLPEDKIVAEGSNLYEEIKEDIERVIKGNLAGYIAPATLLSWATPETTPETIRAIGGRLGAAFIYRRRYSEDSLDDPQYAQVKYNEAMMMIQGIISGDITLTEVPLELGLSLTEDMFFPNSTTDAPKFTMDSAF